MWASALRWAGHGKPPFALRTHWGHEPKHFGRARLSQPQQFRKSWRAAAETAALRSRFMESFDLQHWTHIGAMNPVLQRKPKRQRTGAVQDLAEARKHLAFACVLDCGVLCRFRQRVAFAKRQRTAA